MGVSTTRRNNMSMWILIYSFSDTYCVWAACGLTGYVATWLRGYVATRLRGCDYAATWLRGYVATGLCGYAANPNTNTYTQH